MLEYYESLGGDQFKEMVIAEPEPPCTVCGKEVCFSLHR